MIAPPIEQPDCVGLFFPLWALGAVEGQTYIGMKLSNNIIKPRKYMYNIIEIKVEKEHQHHEYNIVYEIRSMRWFAVEH